MILNQLYKTLLIINLLQFSSAAFAENDFHIISLKSYGYKNAGFFMSYDLPCHSKFVGVLVRPTSKTGVIGLSAVIHRKNLLCTSISEEKTKTIEYFRLSPQTLVETTPERLGDGKISLLNPKDIRIWKNETSAEIQVVYDSNGGQFLGVLFKPVGKNKIKIGVLELAKKKTKNSKPLLKQKITIIKPIFPIEDKTYEQYYLVSEKSQSIKSYTLNLATIEKTSVHLSGTGVLTMNYYRDCREIPLGLVVNGKKDKPNFSAQPQKPQQYIMNDNEISLGILMARYRNVICDKGVEQKPILSSFTSQDIRFSKKITKVHFLANLNTQTEEFILKSPTQYTKIINEANDPVAMQIDNAGGCNAEVGAVLSKDKNNFFAIGILEKRTKNSLCENRLKKTSLYEPIILSGTNPIYPLRLKGI